MLGAAATDSQYCHRPKGSLAHTLIPTAGRTRPRTRPGVLRHPVAAVPSPLPHDHLVRNACPGRTHTAAVGVDFQSHGPSDLSLFREKVRANWSAKMMLLYPEQRHPSGPTDGVHLREGRMFVNNDTQIYRRDPVLF